jgi:hypothetical protein
VTLDHCSTPFVGNIGLSTNPKRKVSQSSARRRFAQANSAAANAEGDKGGNDGDLLKV